MKQHNTLGYKSAVNFSLGAVHYERPQFFGMSAVWTDIQCKIHATALSTAALGIIPSLPFCEDVLSGWP